MRNKHEEEENIKGKKNKDEKKRGHKKEEH